MWAKYKTQGLWGTGIDTINHRGNITATTPSNREGRAKIANVDISAKVYLYHCCDGGHTRIGDLVGSDKHDTWQS